MALVGDNGAGKSTLIKGIAGIHPFDEGEVCFEGERVHIHGPRDAAQLGIEVVYQDLALADNLDVVGNMFLGRERTRFGLRARRVEHGERRRRRPSRASPSRRCGRSARSSPACPAASGRPSRSRSP